MLPSVGMDVLFFSGIMRESFKVAIFLTLIFIFFLSFDPYTRVIG